MNDTDQAAVDDGYGTDYDGSLGREAEAASYPEYPDNPHNHIYTISMDGRGPMIVVRGNTPNEVNERFQALMAGGVTTIAASVYSHLKAEMQVAQGVGPVSPAGPPVQAVQPVPLPQSPQGQYPQPAQQFPGQPGTAPAAWQNVGAPPVTAQSQQQWGQQQGGGGGAQAPQGWFRMNVPYQGANALHTLAQQYGITKGNPSKGGKYNFWSAPTKGWYCAPDVVGAFQQYSPVPA